MPRRMIGLSLIVFFLASHLCAMARINLPSQDGLKFISIAQQFTHQPIWDVIRSADQHPFYPASIALIHGLVAPFGLDPHIAWRIAAQMVSVVAALATLWPLYQITCRLFRPFTGFLAVFLWLLLPLPMSLGHETLSDTTALCCMVWSLYFGLLASESEKPESGWLSACMAALCVAAGYWTRPETILAAPAICMIWLMPSRESIRIRITKTVVFSSLVGLSILAYLGINGSVSDRFSAFMQPNVAKQYASSSNSQLPKGLPLVLRDPSLDFSPKDPSQEFAKKGLKAGLYNLVRQWAESLGDALAFMTIWGIFRCRIHNQNARRLIAFEASLLMLALVWQGSSRGYLSSRHVLGLTFFSVPFLAAAIRLYGLKISAIFRISSRGHRFCTRLAIAGLCLGGLWVQAKPIHASRQGHYKAGVWLNQNSKSNSAVFDTRGWASFQADLKRYDTYHISQAISDRNTSYWVLESGELTSGSKRAATLAKILDDGGELVARFPKKQGHEDGGDVLVFSWKRPEWWDRISPATIAEQTPKAKRDESVEQAKAEMPEITEIGRP